MAEVFLHEAARYRAGGFLKPASLSVHLKPVSFISQFLRRANSARTHIYALTHVHTCADTHCHTQVCCATCCFWVGARPPRSCLPKTQAVFSTANSCPPTAKEPGCSTAQRQCPSGSPVTCRPSSLALVWRASSQWPWPTQHR